MWGRYNRAILFRSILTWLFSYTNRQTTLILFLSKQFLILQPVVIIWYKRIQQCICLSRRVIKFKLYLSNVLCYTHVISTLMINSKRRNARGCIYGFLAAMSVAILNVPIKAPSCIFSVAPHANRYLFHKLVRQIDITIIKISHFYRVVYGTYSMSETAERRYTVA